jgi:hypothetical protein
MKIADNITQIEYYVTSISDGYVESNPSDTVLIVFPENETVLPPPILDHIADASGTVTLLWPVPETNAVTGYNIYRRTEEGITEKLNDEPVMENFFRDTTFTKTGNTIYQVESLNRGGKPSTLRTETTVFRQPQMIQWWFPADR